MSESRPFALRVTLVSGRVYKFHQDDPVIARQNLNRLQPDRVFVEPALVVVGSGRTVTIQTRHIIRLDVDTSSAPWTLREGVVAGEELDTETFREQMGEFEQGWSRDQRVAAGQEIVVFLELEDVRGECSFLRISTKAAADVVRPRLIRQLLSWDVIPAKRGETHSLINPAQLVSAQLFPAPLEGSYKDLQADRV